MKRLIALAALVAVPDIAAAQSTRPAPGQDRQQTGPTPRPPRPGAGGPQVQPPRPGPGGPQIQPPRPGTGGPQIQPPRPGRPSPPPRPRPPRPVPPHRPGAGRPPNFRPIHGPVFHYPRGYRYRRWLAGAILPRLLIGSRYYFSNYAALGVGPPPPGHRWVRYGPDLLLVRQRDRRIVDVIQGAFY